MAKAKKLKSGNWRVLVFSHYEVTVTPDGPKKKRIYESFTAPTKREAEALAAMWAAKKHDRKEGSIDIGTAMDRYIAARSNVLSPSTIREYRRMSEKNFNDLKEIQLNKLSSETLQKWVNQFSCDHNPKTTNNAYGFLSAVLAAYYPDSKFSVVLPKRIPYVAHVPTDREILELIAFHHENDQDMFRASCLAAFGTLRRSEVCALTADDVEGNFIRIRKAMVDSGNGEWIIKLTNKTNSSNRIVEYPASVISILPKQGRLVDLNPDQVTRRHERALKALKIPLFRFHDLRHYTASVMHAIGIPDQYIMDRGGWSSDKTLKAIYRGQISDYKNMYTDMANDHFDEIMQHEMQHKKRKA